MNNATDAPIEATSRAPKKVRDTMTKDVVTVKTDTPFSELVNLMCEKGISGLPVVDEAGHVVGVVTEADLVVKEHRAYAVAIRRPVREGQDVHREHRRRSQGLVAGELMTTPAVTVNESADLRVASRLLTRHGIKRLPVVAGGCLVGILSRRDILRSFTRPDEEIRSMLSDEIRDARILADTESVRIGVDDGVVTLEGHVDRRTTARAIRFQADRLDGVTKVLDRLTFNVDDVRPNGARQPAFGPSSTSYR